MSWTAIVNPRAGRRSVDVETIAAAASRFDVDLDIRPTSTVSDVTSAVADARQRGEHRFVAVGGDGTAHVLANALMCHEWPTRPSLAVVASGSGSDLVKTFGHERGVEAGISRLQNPDLYPIDVGLVTISGQRTYFLNAVNVGVGARSAQVAERLPRWMGGTRYIAAFWIALARYRSGRMDVNVDRHSFSDHAINVVIANGQFFGGGMNIAPRASTTDGLFDVQVFSGRKRLAFTVMPRVLRGTHLSHRAVRRYVGSSVMIDGEADLAVEADGELLGTGPLEVQLIPAAIDLVV
jgi:YegS/Rv2252/BmrU family lipid kinase